MQMRIGDLFESIVNGINDDKTAQFSLGKRLLLIVGKFYESVANLHQELLLLLFSGWNRPVVGH